MSQAAGDRRPVLLTFAGTGVDMWTGYPADIARAVGDAWYWQPVNYGPNGIPATFPMGPSVDSGFREGLRLIREEHPNASGYGVLGYSQGAEPASMLLNEFRSGSLRDLSDRFVGGTVIGNPMREKGRFIGATDPGGRGISQKRLVDTPRATRLSRNVPAWNEYVEPGDIYANVPDNEIGDDMTAIYRLIMIRSILDLIGPGNSLLEQVTELLQSPLQRFPAAVQAIIKALMFFGAKPATAAHIEYHLRQVQPGRTYFEHAVNRTRELGLAALSVA